MPSYADLQWRHQGVPGIKGSFRVLYHCLKPPVLPKTSGSFGDLNGRYLSHDRRKVVFAKECLFSLGPKRDINMDLMGWFVHWGWPIPSSLEMALKPAVQKGVADTGTSWYQHRTVFFMFCRNGIHVMWQILPMHYLSYLHDLLMLVGWSSQIIEKHQWMYRGATLA